MKGPQNIKNKIEYKFIDEPSEDEGFNELDDIFITKKINLALLSKR